LPRAFLGSRAILRRFRPDLVFGVGGYASGPIVLTAALTGYATALLEQNSRPGVTNRLLGRFVRRIFIAFDESRRYFAATKTTLSGNPVRRSFFTERLQTGATAPTETLLIVGGSQGARAVNDLVSAMVPLLVPMLTPILAQRGALPRIVHQTGAADFERIRQRYQEAGGDIVVHARPYIDDMPDELAKATLVIGRAGALTLAELAIVGCPAILIPLPTAADDHQTANARELARAGAAILLPQAEATAAGLAQLVASLLNDPGRRAAMGAAMAALGRPGAARVIVDELERLAAPAPSPPPSPPPTPTPTPGGSG
jgi:UDP-N-acetylglucosamine--N-acetylmuramyl-(pentapeptide) pyrophosphoryl-undecaprenol N-acetylglucosamine transferase